MKFDNINLLKNAVVHYSVKNVRQVRYVKNEKKDYESNVKIIVNGFCMPTRNQTKVLGLI